MLLYELSDMIRCERNIYKAKRGNYFALLQVQQKGSYYKFKGGHRSTLAEAREDRRKLETARGKGLEALAKVVKQLTSRDSRGPRILPTGVYKTSSSGKFIAAIVVTHNEGKFRFAGPSRGTVEEALADFNALKAAKPYGLDELKSTQDRLRGLDQAEESEVPSNDHPTAHGQNIAESVKEWLVFVGRTIQTFHQHFSIDRRGLVDLLLSLRVKGIHGRLDALLVVETMRFRLGAKRDGGFFVPWLERIWFMEHPTLPTEDFIMAELLFEVCDDLGHCDHRLETSGLRRLVDWLQAEGESLRGIQTEEEAVIFANIGFAQNVPYSRLDFIKAFVLFFCEEEDLQSSASQFMRMTEFQTVSSGVYVLFMLLQNGRDFSRDFEKSLADAEVAMDSENELLFEFVFMFELLKVSDFWKIKLSEAIRHKSRGLNDQ